MTPHAANPLLPPSDWTPAGAAQAEAGPFAPGQAVGDYQILEEVGQGGMCIVYKAYQQSLKRVVALKVLRPSLASNPSVAGRFRSESILAGNLSHPNILPVFSHGQVPPDPPFFTMEFAEGRSVEQTVRRHGPVEPGLAIRIAIDACRALHHAHSRKIIHRDVTPRNILLQNGNHVRLLDFGIAQDTSGRLARTTTGQAGMAFGTIAFMSPEQNLCQKLDRRTDVFSLGMTLYYMLTGRVAYLARNRQELALAFQLQTPRPPRRINPAVPAELSRIVMKMIAVDRGERYGDCAEVLADLHRAAGGKRLAGPRKGWSRRRIAWVAAVHVAVLAMLAALLLPHAAPRADRANRGAGTGESVELARAETPDLTAPTGQPEPIEPVWTAPPPEPGASTESEGPNVPASDSLAALGPDPGGADGPAQASAHPDPPVAPTDAPDPSPTTQPAPTPSEADPAGSTVVLWAYQPDGGRDFGEEGKLTGKRVVHGLGDSGGRLFRFDPRRGLAAHSRDQSGSYDVRLSADEQGLAVLCHSPETGTGSQLLTSLEAFSDDDVPAEGYKAAARYRVRPGQILLLVVRCAHGGHAKLLIEHRR